MLKHLLTIFALSVLALVYYPARVLRGWYLGWRGCKAFPASSEVPPAHEAPTIPRDFRPRKHKAVKDRIAWRHAHPRDAEAIARHARQLHFHDQEIAEARHG